MPHKVVQCFAEMGQFDKIILYAKKVNFEPDYLFQMRQVLRTHPDNAAKFAQMLISEGPNGEPLADINQVTLINLNIYKIVFRLLIAFSKLKLFNNAPLFCLKHLNLIKSLRVICRHVFLK